jgi:molybdopterin synthase catalytic subunit
MLPPMPTAPLSVTADPIDAAAILRLVEESEPAGRFGAMVSFVGTVRRENVGRQVAYLEYEAYEALALKALGLIAAEVAGHWPDVRLAVQHRVGHLDPGEASIAIAAASPHRSEAFQACRYTIERVKQIVPIWKREVFDGGEAWVEGATADPDDAAAREAAYRSACG